MLYWLGLSILSAVGLVVRLINLDHLPSGLYRDEAMNALDGLRALSSGQLPLYYPDNFGRGLFQEGFFANLQGLTSLALGPSMYAARLPAALVGMVGIVTLAFMVRQLFLSRTAALASAGLLAFSYWGINFSRIGFSAILVPTVLAAAIGAMVWAIRHGTAGRMLAAGAVFGLGSYTYAAFRFAPLLAAIILLAATWTKKWHGLRAVRMSVSFFAGAFLTSFPFLVAVLQEPRIITARAQEVSLASSATPTAELLEQVLTNASLASGKFLFLGDLNIRHNYGPYGILSPLVALLLITGVVIAVVWVARYTRVGSRDSSDAVLALGAIVLLSGLCVMTLPEVLSADSVPHSLRAIGSQPFAFALAALPIWLSVTWLRSTNAHQDPKRPWLLAGASLLLAASLSFDLLRYFSALPSSEEQRIAFDTDLLSMIDEAQADSETVILLPYPQQQSIIEYLTWGVNSDQLVYASVDRVVPESTVLLRQSDTSLLEELQRAYPDSQASIVYDPDRNTAFISVSVE